MVKSRGAEGSIAVLLCPLVVPPIVFLELLDCGVQVQVPAAGSKCNLHVLTYEDLSNNQYSSQYNIPFNMAPKKKAGAGTGRGARGAGQSSVKPSSATDPGIDIVFDKPKPKSRGHRQRCVQQKLLKQ